MTPSAFGDVNKAYKIWYDLMGDEYIELMGHYIGTTVDEAVKIRDEHIDRVNFYRLLHGVPGVKMHEELNELAQMLANYIVLTNLYEHGPTKTVFSENLCLIKYPNEAGRNAADLYYDEFFILDEFGNTFNFHGTESEMLKDAESGFRGHALHMI
ncbi:uncharacterized protein LOC126896546 [Daktulosphaira vitifoliae]|uniref:uncharacterized protein LOC126896546 n=1 Tax=Daktulosphaira vitifoliae TaxID=58002 RepID=UPI0021AAFCBC|nr:uncharacterized protein LOC126896546 [Daktulosphaira vitifoliae]